jgi:hypothetical protein
MVTRRRILVLASLLAVPLIGLSLVLFLRAPAHISPESCARIQMGMSKPEVAAIRGETNDRVSMGAGVHSAYYTEYEGGPRGRRATIEVRFDKDDRVFDNQAFQEESGEAWLGRLWRN